MNKKESILQSALELLAQKGVHDTPMSAIAKSANVGMGTIYNYFPNKEMLLNEVYIKIKHQESSVFENFDTNQPIKTQFEQYFVSVTENSTHFCIVMVINNLYIIYSSKLINSYVV